MDLMCCVFAYPGCRGHVLPTAFSVWALRSRHSVLAAAVTGKTGVTREVTKPLRVELQPRCDESLELETWSECRKAGHELAPVGNRGPAARQPRCDRLGSTRNRTGCSGGQERCCGGRRPCSSGSGQPQACELRSNQIHTVALDVYSRSSAIVLQNTHRKLKNKITKG